MVMQAKRGTLAVDVGIKDEPVKLLIDTGTAVSILRHRVYQEKFACRFDLDPAVAMLQDFSGQRIPVIGCFVAKTLHGIALPDVRFHVVPQGIALLSLELRLRIDGASLVCLQPTASTGSLLPQNYVRFPSFFPTNWA